MRRCMIVLAVVGILAGPPLSAADDPFDFSSPLDSGTTRKAQYFSRSKPTQTAEKSSAGHLLAEPETAPQASQSGSVRFERSTATDQPTTRRDPQETLRRFDEYLKSRNVVSAEYAEPTDQPSAGRVQQIQHQEELPEFGDLDNEPTPARSNQPDETIRGLLLGNEPKPRGDKLTHPIATTPTERTSSLPSISPNSTATLLRTTPPQREARPFAQPAAATNFNAPSPFGSAAPAAVHAASTVEMDQAPAAIKTSWTLLDPLNVGQECRAELHVTNTGENAAERVSLEVRVPESVQIISTAPQPVERAAFLGWKIPELAPKQSQTIQVVFTTAQPGSLELSTYVRHTTAHRSMYTVTEPQLELAMSGPKEVNVGEPASQTLIVKNPGTGIANNITIDAIIPDGLEHVTGKHLQMDIGSLNPGEVRSVRLVMGAVSGGNHIVQVEAKAETGIVRTAAAEVTVIAPSLHAGIAGPSLRYLGREAEYTVRVLNDGPAATDFVQVNHRIPEGFEFVRAERGAKYDRATRVLNWYVGRLESGQSLDMTLTLLPTAAGEFVHAVRATSEMGAQADAQLTTRVQGAASLVVKVADLDDPVEVGAETAYEITVTNEGTAPARSVGLTCEIPQGLAFLKAEGPSEHRLQNEMIGFRPIESLDAGKSLTYRVFVQGGVAGDQRFRCRLTSESLKQPLFTEELTKFYSE